MKSEYNGMLDFCKDIKKWAGPMAIYELNDILIQAESDPAYLRTITDAVNDYCAYHIDEDDSEITYDIGDDD